MQRFHKSPGSHHHFTPVRELYSVFGHQKSRPISEGGGAIARHREFDGIPTLASHEALVKTNGNSYQYGHSNNYGAIHHAMSHSSTSLSESSDFQPYYLDRGNGEYTRLIPADTLPPLNEVPPREASVIGKVVLQPIAPRERRVTLKAIGQGPGPDNVQHRIDNIVGGTPPKSRRDKIYCDKWVHEGICAFAQQGCRYKHEMPQDKETQYKLGLYQGFPAWWRKQQGELAQHEAAGSPKTASTCRSGSSGRFTPIDRRATLTNAMRSPVKRQGLGLSVKGSPPLGHDHGDSEAFGDAERLSGVSQGCFGRTKRWTADPMMMTGSGQEQHGRRGGLDQCVWGPIEPPKVSKMRSGYDIND
ncbi:hypothetical protein NLU13_7437 [Sarocladium strictum]|uniref:C3H1-type domain-containing protein n=1 Tax=Sarocladium strictum TaxID=5046 RepID=A0AA39GDH9_SARSR|nr:hypothetical protein NLU13_7437 [Sarocladium strictum]